MTNPALIACRAFLQKCPKDKRQALLGLMESPLPEAPWRDVSKGLTPLALQLDEIHSSWFSQYLRTLPASDIPMFLSALSERQIKELKKVLLFSNHLVTLTPIAKQFLQQTWWDHFTEGHKELLPFDFLPHSPLNPLLTLSVEKLQLLISLLGMRDIALEMPQIIETAKLRKIEESLSQEQQKYLKTLRQHKEPVTFSKMGLGKWDGNKDTLLASIDQRGLNRLAKAIGQDNSHLRWHLSHRFDTAKAAIFEKLAAKIEPKTEELLTAQVVDLLTYLNPHTHEKPL